MRYKAKLGKLVNCSNKLMRAILTQNACAARISEFNE